MNNQISPVKKPKSEFVAPPLTGLPPTPGKGNLFAPIQPKEEWVDEEEETIEAFGEPIKRSITTARLPKGGRRSAVGKENAPVSPRKVKKTVGVVRGIRGRPPRLAV
jgi:hypothetical protein